MRVFIPFSLLSFYFSFILYLTSSLYNPEIYWAVLSQGPPQVMGSLRQTMIVLQMKMTRLWRAGQYLSVTKYCLLKVCLKLVYFFNDKVSHFFKCISCLENCVIYLIFISGALKAPCLSYHWSLALILMKCGCKKQINTIILATSLTYSNRESVYAIEMMYILSI